MFADRGAAATKHSAYLQGLNREADMVPGLPGRREVALEANPELGTVCHSCAQS